MYLAHKISGRGIESDDSKVKVIWEWPTSKMVTKVRNFTNYYQQFIYRYAQVAKPPY